MTGPSTVTDGKQKDDLSVQTDAGAQDETKPTAETSTIPPTESRIIVVLFQGDEDEFSSVDVELVAHYRQLFADKKFESDPETTTVDLWLDSGGGSGDAAYKFVLLLRSIAKKVRVIIPDYAKSAATLMVLGADSIFMAPAAELGPLDAQIQYEQEGIQISALDVAKAVEHLGKTAFSLAIMAGTGVLRITGLSRKDSFFGSLDFAEKFMSPVVGKLDPMMIHRATSQLSVASEYARRLMKMRSLTPEDEARVVQALPTILVERYPHHGFVISPEEARERLGLPIQSCGEYEDWEDVCAVYAAFERAGRKRGIMQVWTPAEVKSQAKSYGNGG